MSRWLIHHDRKCCWRTQIVVLATIRPTNAPRGIPSENNFFKLDALLHPGTMFDHPNDVLAHPKLSLSEKRPILASWSSDASAIGSCPALRAPSDLKKCPNLSWRLDVAPTATR